MVHLDCHDEKDYSAFIDLEFHLFHSIQKH